MTMLENALDLRCPGYSEAVALADGGKRNTKRYLKLDLHEAPCLTDLIGAVMERNPNAEAVSARRLQREVRAIEVSGEMAGAALQLRQETDAGLLIKAYLRPLRQGGLGMSRAIGRIRHLAATEATGSEGITGELRRRDDIAPISYLSLAWRPELEVESYHDLEGETDPDRAARQMQEALRSLLPAGESDELIEMMFRAADLGFVMGHLSCNLIGGAKEVSLSFDLPGDLMEAARPARMARLAVMLGAMKTDDPAAFAAQNGRAPFMFGMKYRYGRGPGGGKVAGFVFDRACPDLAGRL